MERKIPKQALARILSVEETSAVLAKELAEEELKAQESLPKSSESSAPEAPLSKIASVEDRMSSSVCFHRT
jgi:hypothetical protein